MDKKIERLITAGMIARLVAVFFYQVAYGVESGGYPIARNDKYDRMIITYQTSLHDDSGCYWHGGSVIVRNIEKC